jgi:hypothetical protein
MTHDSQKSVLSSPRPWTDTLSYHVIYGVKFAISVAGHIEKQSLNAMGTSACIALFLGTPLFAENKSCQVIHTNTKRVPRYRNLILVMDEEISSGTVHITAVILWMDLGDGSIRDRILC